MWVAEHHGMPSVASSAPGRAHRPPGRRHHHPAGRRRRGHAPQPRPAGGGRAVRHPRGPPPRPDRPRPRPRPGHRPGHGPGPPAPSADLGAEQFPEDVVELINYLVDDDGPATHPAPVPGRGYLPQVWLLGSSTFSAQLAGMLGLPFSFAFHFAPALVDQAVALYRSQLPADRTAGRALPDGGRVGPVRRRRRGGPVAGRAVGADRPPAAHGQARRRSSAPKRPPPTRSPTRSGH